MNILYGEIFAMVEARKKHAHIKWVKSGATEFVLEPQYLLILTTTGLPDN